MRWCFLTSLMLIGGYLLLGGCATTPIAMQQTRTLGPVFVSTQNEEFVWERAVDVLHDYPFTIKRENKLAGVIETEYKVGSGVLEPWHKETIGMDARLESTLQSIRRRVLINVRRDDAGYFVDVEAYKEIEDLEGLAANSAGGATFLETSPLERDYNLVVGQSTPSGWISKGRDFALEQDLLQRLQLAYR
ncbi:hypothetical protein Pla110_46630 [Polystyrenella longa]|uniref:Uncharacterized protein n=1 Tax=Polystyrenella longa TaxID=2528007 RepID=A0A518CUJ4_9PLAN|nr:hypothetical protein [Polystyrenella longa]QDU82900.1 hypothetical protein Pla110_46630 [Polystyrenella longa]